MTTFLSGSSIPILSHIPTLHDICSYPGSLSFNHVRLCQTNNLQCFTLKWDIQRARRPESGTRQGHPPPRSSLLNNSLGFSVDFTCWLSTIAKKWSILCQTWWGFATKSLVEVSSDVFLGKARLVLRDLLLICQRLRVGGKSRNPKGQLSSTVSVSRWIRVRCQFHTTLQGGNTMECAIQSGHEDEDFCDMGSSVTPGYVLSKLIICIGIYSYLSFMNVPFLTRRRLVTITREIQTSGYKLGSGTDGLPVNILGAM